MNKFYSLSLFSGEPALISLSVYILGSSLGCSVRQNWFAIKIKEREKK